MIWLLHPDVPCPQTTSLWGVFWVGVALMVVLVLLLVAAVYGWTQAWTWQEGRRAAHGEE